MTTKLNLTIEEDIAVKIKLYAEKQKTSVSKIAEAYFSRLVSKGHSQKRISDKAAGIIQDLVIDDIPAARDAYLKEKYGI
ncbi:DUF6364 family protein [Niabella sp.]|uniref:DUF6364 family protein n=1 Tax=Niabella sp. TaxID=1962976 RepID=UPI002629996E|nr:DUF6364 family protein [Niabella sp.]